MNRIYKVIWSKVKNCYIVVSEIAKSHSKPISTKLNSGKTVATLLAVAALCAGMTTSVMAADQYYSVDDFEGRLASMGNADNSGAQGIGSMAAGIGSSVQSKSMFQGAMATVVGSLNTVATESTAKAYDGVANSIVGVANATQNANATLIFGAGNAVSNSYGDVTLDPGSINPADPVGTARTLGAAVGDSGGQMLVIGGANSADYARFSAITGVSNKLTGKDGNTSDYNFITGAKNTLTNADSTYVIGSSNTVSDGTSNVVIGDNRKLTGATNDVVIGSSDEEMETTVSDATILGHNANATVADGVALGSKSVASVAKGVAGTVPTGATVSDTDKATPTWKSTLGAVSVGDTANNLTRQITGVAAGTQDTDAVNVAQLNAVNTVVNTNTTKISDLTTTVNANKIRFFSVTADNTDGNADNTAAKGFKSLAVGSSMLTEGHWAATVGVGGITTSYSGNNFGTANHIFNPYNSNKDTISLAVIKGEEEYTYQRDENGKFTDMALWGGLATTIGTFNMIQPDYVAGVLPLDGFNNTLIGGYNSTENSNGAYLLGWNNKVTNSYFVDDEKLPTKFNPAFDVTTMNSESFGGSVVAIGMDNTVDGAQHSYIMGTANTVSGTVTEGTVEKVATDNVVIGDNHKVDNASHTVILGSADAEATTDKDGVVVVGHNANATVADGVALGSNSVASVAAGVAGTVPTGATVSDTDKATPTWKSTLGAVSVGVIGSDGTATATRQITGVAAGTQATDAVNVAQLNAVNTKVDANTLHFVQINQGTSGTNYNNDGAKGTNSIAIGKASTAANDSIIIGEGAISKSGNTTSYPIRSGDIAIGMGVKVNNYVNQGGGIAIGYNARSENMAGQQERYLSLGQTEYTTGIAIGRNTYARSGSTMVGTHNYSGAIGDVTVNTTPEGMAQPNLNPFATTVGANSFSSGTMSTVMGVYSIASSNYTGNRDSSRAPKNFGATIVGSLNSIESATADSNRAGVANSIVGLANRANNANGALIFGAGNEITNSVTPIVVPMDASIASAKDLQTNLISSIRASNSAGSTMAMGGGNKADYTQLTSIMGVNNTVTGTSDDISMYNYISGFNNTVMNTDNVTVTGTNRTVSGANNTIVIGSADSTVETTASDAVAVGRNSNVTVDGGVALGTNSVASVDKGAIGYDQSGKITDVPYDKEKYQSLQTQISETQNSISTLTSEATGLQSNLDQIKSWYPDSYEQMEQYQGIQAQLTAKQNEIAEAQANLATQESELGEVLQTASTWQATAAAVSVGDVSKGITRQITGVAAGTQDTDAVNVAQLKAAKVEVVGSGNNVTVTSDNSEGYTKYSIAATDTQVTGLSLDKNTLTLTQNGLEPLTVEGIATTAELAANKVKYFSVKSELTDNQDNTGAKGTNSIAIGPNAVAQRENGIALGTNVYSGGKGSIVIGSDAKVLENIALEGSIVIGKGAEAFTGGGQQEALLGMDPTNWPNRGVGGYDNPKDASRVATSIVIGTNASGRTGSIDIGDRVYKGTMGGKEITDKNSSFHVNQTTLGTNSYNKGLFATMVGSYSIATGGFTGAGGMNTMSYGTQNFGATVLGSLNSIRSNGDGDSDFTTMFQGVANTIVGLGNITDNSNGSLVFGAGNKITNSLGYITAPSDGASSVDDMVDKLQSAIKDAQGGGSTLAIGGGNTADYTQASSIIGVNNTLTGTSSDVSQYNALTGYNNTATNVDNVTVTGVNNTVSKSTSIVNLGNENAVADSNNTILLGDNRTVTGSDNSVILGRANKAASTTLRAAADTTLTTTADNVVVMGYNANATVDDGVALGSNSVASVDRGVDGYNPSTKALTGSTWTSTVGSVSVGDAANDITRQITGVAAGKEDTDAVNVAQLKANKVTVAAGDNVTVTPTTADDGSTTYTVASTDTNTVLESGKIAYNDKGTDGTITLTDSANNKVTVEGVKNTYLTEASLSGNTLTLTQNEGDPLTVTGLATTSQVEANKIHYFHVNSEANGTNYNNNGASGTDAIAIGKSSTSGANSIAMGQSTTAANNSVAIGKVTISDSNGGKGSGDIAIGNGANINNYVDQGASIAIGQNAKIENMSGTQEYLFAMGQTTFHPGNLWGTIQIPDDPSKQATGIAIGENTYARTGSLMVGSHNYRGAMGDVTVDSADTKAQGVNINSTTLGTNSYNGGAFATITGAYSIASSNYNGGASGVLQAAKNFGATIMGSLNSVESATAGNSSGIANSVVGVANRTFNSNGSLIFGAGNEITNSITTINAPSSAGDSAKALQTTLMNSIKSSNSGGSTLAIGGGNKADYTQQSALIGVNNTLTGTSGNISQYNYITGFKNTGTNVDNVTIIGTNRTVSDAANSVVIGSADSAMTSSASDAVTIGRNANTTVDGGVALGSNSVASVAAEVAGYDPITTKASTETSATWKSTLAAVSVGALTEDGAATATRQITGVAAGMQDTDAVNVAQLKAAKVEVLAGTNISSVDSDTKEGYTKYTVNAIDTKVTGGSATYGTDGTGTITLNTDTNGTAGTVTVSGLTDKFINGASLSGNTLTITRNDGEKFTVDKIATTDDITGENSKVSLNFTGDDTTEVVNTKSGGTLNIKGGAEEFTTDDNIGVEKDGESALKVRLAKELTMADGNINFNNGVKLSSAGLSNGGQKITNVAAGTDANDAVNVSQLNANKVTVVEGTNVKLDTVKTDDGTTYTVNAIDTKVTGGSATYGTDGTGTITLNTDTNGTAGTVTVSGLTDKFINGASLSGNTLTITRNDGEKFTVDKIATTDDITGENSKVSLNFTGDDTTEVVNTKSGGTLNIKGGAEEFTTDDNIGVEKDGESALKVRLAKELTMADGNINFNNGVKLSSAGLSNGGQKITNVAAGTDANDAVNVSQLNANKVTVVEGTNVKLDTVKTDDGTTYTVNAIDTKVTGGSATYGTDGSGTITLNTDTNGTAGTVTVSGLTDKFINGASLSGNTLTITRNDGEKFTVDKIATTDDITGENSKVSLNFTGDDTTEVVNTKSGGTLNIKGGAEEFTTDDNIGVEKDGESALKVRLAKELTMADGNINFNNGVKLSSAGLSNGGQKITNVAAGTDANDAVNVSQLNANKVTVVEGTNVKLDTVKTDDGTTYTVNAIDTKVTGGSATYGTDGTGTITLNTDTNGTAGTVTVSGLTDKFINGASLSGNTLTITRNDGEKFEVGNIATKDDITGENSIVNMKFAGDDGTEITKKNGETLNVVGGVDKDKLTVTDNIGVVEDNGNLKVKLAKDLTGIDSARIGGTVTNGVASGGIYIANQTGVKNTMGKDEDDGLYITGLTNTTWNPKANGYVSGRAATEDQLNSVYETINSNIESSKAVSGKNITVDKDNKVNLNDEITLGDAASNNVAISGTNGTITAGDGVNNKVAIDGTKSTITAGTGDNKVTVDGNTGLVTVGDTTKGAISIGNQTVTPKVVGADGTETDGTAKTGKYITGLENTTWDPTGEGYVADRAATEGQLKDIADKIGDIDTAVKSSSRVFESDSGADKQVTRKNTDAMKLKGGADANNLSDNNIGVVNNSDGSGFDIKLSKDIKGLNSIEVNNKITIGTGDNQTIIEGDTINTGSVTTGNTTINNNGLTIVNEDSSKNITINNNNVNMGGNVIKNIGEGSEPTDAINKTQFDRAINNLGTGMNQINNRVNKLDNRVNRVGAGAAALAALHPLEFSPDAKWEVTAGVGNYRGANAIALGAFYRPNFDTMFSIGTSYGGGENMINAGVTWRIGEGETKAYPSKTVMAQEIDDLKNVVSEQQDQIEELKKLVNTLINK